MSLFSRRARWLNQLFPPSVAPVVRDPSSRSDDVSLVQPYDGGGWGLSRATFPPEYDFDTLLVPLEITEPELAIRDYVTQAGIATTSQLFTLGENVYGRVFSLTYLQIVGAGGNNSWSALEAPPGSGVSNHSAVFTFPENTSGTTTPIPMGRSSNVDATLWANNKPVIPPGFTFVYHENGGGVTTQKRISVLMMVLPVGAVNYI